MIFLYFLAILTSGVRSQDSCEVEVSRNTGKCSDGFLYFYRTPRPENQYTSGWCLKLIVDPSKVSQTDAENVCVKIGAHLSIFENLGEQTKVFEKFPASEGGNNWVRVDGYRKKKCYTTEAINKDPECYKGLAFKMSSNFSDPKYQLNNFWPGDPNYLPQNPHEHAENCLTAAANPHDHHLVDTSCLSNPGDNVIRGVLCGKPTS